MIKKEKKTTFTNTEKSVIESLQIIGSFGIQDNESGKVRLFDHTRYPFAKVLKRTVDSLIEKGAVEIVTQEGKNIYQLKPNFNLYGHR